MATHRPRVKRPTRIHTQIAPRYVDLIKPARLKQAANAALDQPCVADRVELTIVIAGNAQLRQLNRQFRHIDAPTDVLSFNAHAEGRLKSALLAEDETAYLGDVIISYPQAKAQARAGGHPIEAELQLLVVHGVLHLLGHDHDTAAKKAQMWQAQAAALRSIRAAITDPTD
jgi:probable rRNA maturation factor